jgi:hypothetical protein
MAFDFTPFRAGKRGVAMRRPSGFCLAAAVVGLVLLLPAGAFAEPEGAGQLEVPPGGIVHTVVAGDTLWDLSAKYMGSPWKWKEIWELNRFVTNPHYIYPGIRIVIVPPGPRKRRSSSSRRRRPPLRPRLPRRRGPPRPRLPLHRVRTTSI